MSHDEVLGSKVNAEDTMNCSNLWTRVRIHSDTPRHSPLNRTMLFKLSSSFHLNCFKNVLNDSTTIAEIIHTQVEDWLALYIKIASLASVKLCACWGNGLQQLLHILYTVKLPSLPGMQPTIGWNVAKWQTHPPHAETREY